MKLFQSIAENATYPKLWQKANITPTFKMGSKFCIQSYCRINNLKKLSLVFERTLFKTLYPFVRKIISPRQFGFTKGRSTITQLILYLDEIYKAHDKDDVFCLYLDFRKAFDCVQHSILLNKSGRFEFGGNLLRLAASYLTNREQCVKAESCLSSWASVPSSTEIDFGTIAFSSIHQ